MFTPANTSAAQVSKVFNLPLKLIVQAKYIGAIIGRGGNTIREISKTTKAKCMVDVYSYMQDGKGNQENMVIINGNLDCCSKACVKILQIIHGEVEKERGIGADVELKIRVIDQLVGRLIGKGGSSVKAIMEETGATISINDPHHSMDYGHYPIVPLDANTLDRTIIIRGSSLEIVSDAERKISQKLRLFYESDMLTKRIYPANNNKKLIPMVTPPPPLVFLNSPMYSNDSCMGGYCMSAPPMASSPTMMYCQSPFSEPSYTQKMTVLPSPVQLKSRIYVPSCFVGSLIGSKGTYIRSMMQFTGAMISIESSAKDRNKSTDGKSEKSDKTKKSSSSDNKEKTEDSNEKSEPEEVKKVNKKTAAGDMKDVTPVKITPEKSSEKSESKNAEGKKTNKISPRKKKLQGFGVLSEDNDRCVSISGYDFQVYKAEYFIFKRIADSSHCFLDELILNTETIVPNKIIGRIVGKNGRNLVELQSMTQTRIQVQDRGNDKTPESKGSDAIAQPQETAVGVTGTFLSLQAVQTRFCALITETELHHDNKVPRGSTSVSLYSPMVMVGSSEMANSFQ